MTEGPDRRSRRSSSRRFIAIRDFDCERYRRDKIDEERHRDHHHSNAERSRPPTESTFTELHARNTIMPIQTGMTGHTNRMFRLTMVRQAVAPEVPFDDRQERVLVADDAIDFEAAARDFALEISALGGGRPSPLPRRLDDLLEDAGGMRGAHRASRIRTCEMAAAEIRAIDLVRNQSRRSVRLQTLSQKRNRSVALTHEGPIAFQRSGLRIGIA